VREDGRLMVQISDGSAHLKNPVIGAGTQSQLPSGTGQELLARMVQLALRVGADFQPTSFISCQAMSLSRLPVNICISFG
jgi:hypothetical protein